MNGIGTAKIDDRFYAGNQGRVGVGQTDYSLRNQEVGSPTWNKLGWTLRNDGQIIIGVEGTVRGRMY